MQQSLVRAAFAIGLFALTPSGLLAESPDEAAARIHREAIVVDLHADTLARVIDGRVDLGVRGTSGDIDIPRLKEGGVDCEFFSVWPAAAFRSYGFFKRSMDLIDCFHGLVERYPGSLVNALTVADVRAAAAQGKIALMMGVEGGHAIENDLRALSIFQRLGVRYVTLTWSFSTDWADSSGDGGKGVGLTAFGKDVVREMNRLGIAVDVSHVSDKAFYDALAASTKPVIASHSDCRALDSHRRNLTDDMLKALAAKGGVVGINFYPCFLDDRFRADYTALEKRLKGRLDAIDKEYQKDPGRAWIESTMLLRHESRSLRRVTVSRLADHIEHAVKVAGIDHVGLGSDFDGIDAEIQGLEDCSKMPALTAELLRRGFSEADVKKILGENFLSVLQEIIGR